MPVPQHVSEIVDVVRLVPQERVQRIDGHVVDVPVAQIMYEFVEEFKTEPQMQFSERICEQIVDVPVPQVHVQDILVPTIIEEIAGVLWCTPRGLSTSVIVFQGQKSEVVAAGETGLAGRVMSAWKDFR